MNRRPVDESEDGAYEPSDGEVTPKKRDPKGKKKAKTLPELSVSLWKFVGEERCEACITQGLSVCAVDASVLSAWRTGVEEEGKTYSRAPGGSACEKCKGRQKRCLLPWSLDLREAFVPARANQATVVVPKRKTVDPSKRKRSSEASTEAGDEASESSGRMSKKAKVVKEAGGGAPGATQAGASAPAWASTLLGVGTEIVMELKRQRRAQEALVEGISELAEGTDAVWREVKGISESQEAIRGILEEGLIVAMGDSVYRLPSEESESMERDVPETSEVRAEVEILREERQEAREEAALLAAGGSVVAEGGAENEMMQE